MSVVKASLVYKVGSVAARAMKRNLVSKNQVKINQIKADPVERRLKRRGERGGRRGRMTSLSLCLLFSVIVSSEEFMSLD